MNRYHNIRPLTNKEWAFYRRTCEMMKPGSTKDEWCICTTRDNHEIVMLRVAAELGV